MWRKTAVGWPHDSARRRVELAPAGRRRRASRPHGPGASLRDGVATLLVNRRFSPDSGIARLSDAILRGDGQEALASLQDDTLLDVDLVPLADDELPGAEQLGGVRADAQHASSAIQAAAASGDAAAARAAMHFHRLMCAHRRGLRTGAASSRAGWRTSSRW